MKLAAITTWPVLHYFKNFPDLDIKVIGGGELAKQIMDKNSAISNVFKWNSE